MTIARRIPTGSAPQFPCSRIRGLEEWKEASTYRFRIGQRLPTVPPYDSPFNRATELATYSIDGRRSTNVGGSTNPCRTSRIPISGAPSSEAAKVSRLLERRWSVTQSTLDVPYGT